MLATEWVAPGKGETAGFLWDLAANSVVLRDAPSQVRAEFLSHGMPSEGMRLKRTRLAFGAAYRGMELRLLQPMDLERIMAAIWEWDRTSPDPGAFYDERDGGGECGDGGRWGRRGRSLNAPTPAVGYRRVVGQR